MRDGKRAEPPAAAVAVFQLQNNDNKVTAIAGGMKCEQPTESHHSGK